MSNKELIAELRADQAHADRWKASRELDTISGRAADALEAAQARIEALEAEPTRLAVLEAQSASALASIVNKRLEAERDALAARVSEVEDDNRALRKHASDKDRYAGECLLLQQELAVALDAIRKWRDENQEHLVYEATDEQAAECSDECEWCALDAILDAAPADHLNTVKVEAIHEAAEVVRRNCTAPSELTWPTVQIDALIAWVADWIENPPEWVHVSYRTEQGEGAVKRMTCPGCGHEVYLDPLDGWRNDSDGFTCEPPRTTHSQHIMGTEQGEQA